jgi:transcriptional regulator NrdR family protein
MLERTNDPECPRCGCTDTTMVEERMRFGARVERRECSHCGNHFTPTGLTAKPVAERVGDEQAEDELDGAEAGRGARSVAYSAQPARCLCPQCRSRNPAVKSTQRGDDGRTVRHHRCGNCGHRFKSIEDAG